MKIASFDGGGIRALAGLACVAQYEKKYAINSFRKQFDMFVGTSAGAFIALAFAVLNLNAVDLILKVEQLIKEVFATPTTRGPLLKCKYSLKNLRCQLTKMFGNKRLGEAKKRVMISSYNLSSHKLIMFDSDKDTHLSCVDAALASAAVPGYFDSVCVQGQWYVDGGVVLNNPSAYVISLMLPQNPDLKVLSVGTGIYKPKLDGPNSWGLLQWGYAGLTHVFFDTSHLDQICHALLPEKDRFLRITSDITIKMNAIDNVTDVNIAHLVMLGLQWFTKFESKLHSFIIHQGGASL